MNREIKFRAWGGSEEKYMVYFDLYDMTEDYFGGYASDGTIHSKNQPLEIMQFTGLKDKNGKEIYEGDIVKYQSLEGFEAEESLKNQDAEGVEATGKVKFIDGEFTPRDTGNYPEDGYYGWRTFKFEVVGNVYENPELLPNPNRRI